MNVGFIWRWLCAFLLLAVTINPTEFNYLSWVRDYGSQNLSLAVLFGLLLLIGYVIYLRATLRSIGAVGMFLVGALVGACIWVLIDLGILSLANSDLNMWMGLFTFSFVLGIGLSWSIFRRALSGQADVDDVDA